MRRAILSILISSAVAQVYTVTQWPSICSAIYTSGSASVTVVQSTVTSTPQWSEYNVNAGLVPFVLSVNQPTPFGPVKRQSTYWLQANGNTTLDGGKAAQFYMQNGQLRSTTGQWYSTAPAIDNQTMALTYNDLPIVSTFTVKNGVLTWSNTAFNNGQAQFFKTPAALQENARVIAYFRGNQPVPYSWSPAALRAQAVSDAMPSMSSSQLTSVATSIISNGVPTSLDSATGPFSYEPTTPTDSSTSTSIWNSLSLSTITAPGTPIGPNRPTIYTYPTDSSSTSSFNSDNGLASYPSNTQTSSSTDAVSVSSSSSSVAAQASTSSQLPTPAVYTSSSPLVSSSSRPLAQTTSTSSLSPAQYSFSSSSSSSSSQALPTTYPGAASTTSSAAAMPSGYACPRADGSIVQDAWGTQYLIGCSKDTTYGDFTSKTATNSWNDCFAFCHNATTLDGTGRCTAFTYYGGAYGNGIGTCFLKNERAESFLSASPNYVAAIQVAYLAGSGSSATAGSSPAVYISSSSSSPAAYTSSSSTSSAPLAYSSTSSTSSAPAAYTSTSSSSTSSSSRTSSSSTLLVASTTTSTLLQVYPTTTSSSSTSSAISSSSTRTSTSSSSSTSSSQSSSSSSSRSSTSTSTVLASTSTSSRSSSSASTSTRTSTSSSYLVLASPTPCDFGDVAGTDQDDSYCEIDVPAPIRMYSRSSSATFASSNGFIALTNGSSQYQVSPVPYSQIPNSTVLALMDDLMIYGRATPAQGIFYQANTTAVTYEYYMATANLSTAIVHFTVGYTYANPGIFTMTYYNVGNGANGNTSSVGIQGLTAAGAVIASQYSYKTQSIFPGMVLVCDTNQNQCSRTQ